MVTRQKTFTATTPQALDNLVNSFIDRQTADTRTVIRTVLFQSFVIDGSDLYVTLIYREDAES